AVERGLDAVVGRRGDDDLADRRGVVEHVAEVGPQLTDVERLGARQRVLLGDREQQLDADRRALDRDPVRQREHHRDRGLVVGAEDRLVAVGPAALLADRLDRDVAVRNSGAGFSGRDLNSGWNCEATKNGWSLSSMISTRRSSGDVPDTTSPAASSLLRSEIDTS